MNWIFIAVLAFSVLTVHCLNDKQTIDELKALEELKATLEPFQKRLDSALVDYKKHNYVVFQHVIDDFDTVEELTMSLQNNVTPGPESASEKLRYALNQLTAYQFIYPVLSDPIKLSDALKMNALYSSLQNDVMWIDVNNNSIPLKGVKNRIKTVIELENKDDFNAAYAKLEELYSYSEENNTMIFYLISGYSKHTLGMLKEYIHSHELLIGSNRSSEVLQNIEGAELFLKNFEKLLPFDKQEKIEPMVEVLEEYRKLINYFYYLPITVECFGIRCEGRKQTDYEIQRIIYRTLPELVEAVEYYRADLDDRIAFYKDNNYTVFARTALQYVYSPSLKSAIERLPANSSIDDSLEAKETFTKLTIYKYVYPILNDPRELSQAFIADALVNKIIKNESLNETEDTIWKIVDQLEKMHYKFNQTDFNETDFNQTDFNQVVLTFNDLHEHLGMPNPDTFVLTFHFVRQQIQIMEDFCRSNLCSEELVWNLKQFKYWSDQRAFPPFYYFELPNILKQFWKFRSEVERNKLEENIDCDVIKCTKKR